MRTWVVLALAMVAPAVSAQPESTRLFEEGRALAKRGDFVDACNLFTQSFALDPAPGTELNLGDCHEHLGHLIQARHYFDAAARNFRQTHDDRAKFARDRRDAITPRLGTVVVRVADPHVHVTVAGADQPPAREMEVEVDPGDVEVRAGEATWHVQVSPGGTATVDAAGHRGPSQHADTLGERRHDRVRLAYMFGGVGAVTGVIGIALGVTANSAYQEQFTNGDCMKTVDGPVCNYAGIVQLHDAISTANWGTRLGVASVLAFGVGALVYLTAPREPVVVTPTASASGAGVVVTGSF